MKESKVKLKFCLWDFEDVTHEQISAILQITPSETFIKGQAVNPPFKILAKENGWLIDAGLSELSDFETQLNKLLDIIESRKDEFVKFSNKYYCEFSCA